MDQCYYSSIKLNLKKYTYTIYICVFLAVIFIKKSNTYSFCESIFLDLMCGEYVGNMFFMYIYIVSFFQKYKNKQMKWPKILV